MQHLIKTNGEDGTPLNGVPSSEATGGIWKQVIYTGVGETPPLGSTVRVHYNAYFELNDEPYDSTVSFFFILIEYRSFSFIILVYKTSTM